MMNKITNKILAAVMAGSALLLSMGNLLIVNALQPQNLNNAILHLVCGIVVAATVTADKLAKSSVLIAAIHTIKIITG